MWSLISTKISTTQKLSATLWASAFSLFMTSNALAQVEIKVFQTGAKIYVDGVAKGTGNAIIPILDHPQQIEINAVGYATFRRRLPAANDTDNSMAQWNVVLPPETFSEIEPVLNAAKIPVSNLDNTQAQRIESGLRSLQAELSKLMAQSKLLEDRVRALETAPAPQTIPLPIPVAAVPVVVPQPAPPAPAQAPPAPAPAVEHAKVEFEKIDPQMREIARAVVEEHDRGEQAPKIYGRYFQFLSAPLEKIWTTSQEKKIKAAFEQTDSILKMEDVIVCAAFTKYNRLWQRILIPVPIGRVAHGQAQLKAAFDGTIEVRDPICRQAHFDRQPSADDTGEPKSEENK